MRIARRKTEVIQGMNRCSEGNILTWPSSLPSRLILGHGSNHGRFFFFILCLMDFWCSYFWQIHSLSWFCPAVTLRRTPSLEVGAFIWPGKDLFIELQAEHAHGLCCTRSCFLGRRPCPLFLQKLRTAGSADLSVHLNAFWQNAHSPRTATQLKIPNVLFSFGPGPASCPVPPR